MHSDLHVQWSCRESNPRRDLRKCGLTCVGLRQSTAESAKVPANYAGVVGESNMSTLPAVVPRVFAGLSLICEQSPGDRAKPHICGPSAEPGEEGTAETVPNRVEFGRGH